MNKNQTTSVFKQFDLLFFSILAIISDLMSYVLLERLNSSFYFSFSIALCLIAMIRWGQAGVLVGLAGGIPGIFFSDMKLWSGITFYALANAALVIPIAFYGKRNRDRIVEHTARLVFYILISHGCLSLGKGAVILLVTGEATGVVDFFGATFFILVINIILCCVLNKRDGLLHDMRYYFLPDDGETETSYRERLRGGD